MESQFLGAKIAKKKEESFVLSAFFRIFAAKSQIMD